MHERLHRDFCVSHPIESDMPNGQLFRKEYSMIRAPRAGPSVPIASLSTSTRSTRAVSSRRGNSRNSSLPKCARRLVYGVASLPLGTPVELEVIFEVGEEN